jgi:carbonic anhydrase
MSIGMSPFKALYSYDPLTFEEIVFGDSKAPMEKEWIQVNQDIIKNSRTISIEHKTNRNYMQTKKGGAHF